MPVDKATQQELDRLRKENTQLRKENGLLQNALENCLSMMTVVKQSTLNGLYRPRFIAAMQLGLRTLQKLGKRIAH